jgi:hypothetical protein
MTSCVRILVQTKTDRRYAHVIHSAVLLFPLRGFPNGCSSLADSFHIAMCHLVWLLGRKYGTVWYHPASSKLWYLTALSFVNFQEKLTDTSFALCACEASFVRLAVCLALSALFASTGRHASYRIQRNWKLDHVSTMSSFKAFRIKEANFCARLLNFYNRIPNIKKKQSVR